MIQLAILVLGALAHSWIDRLWPDPPLDTGFHEDDPAGAREVAGEGL